MLRDGGASYQPDSQEAARGEKGIGVQPTACGALS